VPLPLPHLHSKSFDLGQFERFRRIMHIPAYKPLLNHEEVQLLSTLQVSVGVAGVCCVSCMHLAGRCGVTTPAPARAD
jgi:hypothetical protein